MIFAATIAALTLSPVIVKDQVVAFRIMADVAGRQRPVVVQPHHAQVIADAISSGAGQRISVRSEKGLHVLVDSQDPTLRAALVDASAAKREADRAADPLGFALGDLAWARQMLRAARADVTLHDDVPGNWVANHEANVARLTTLVETLGGVA